MKEGRLRGSFGAPGFRSEDAFARRMDHRSTPSPSARGRIERRFEPAA